MLHKVLKNLSVMIVSVALLWPLIPATCGVMAQLVDTSRQLSYTDGPPNDNPHNNSLSLRKIVARFALCNILKEHGLDIARITDLADPVMYKSHGRELQYELSQGITKRMRVSEFELFFAFAFNRCYCPTDPETQQGSICESRLTETAIHSIGELLRRIEGACVILKPVYYERLIYTSLHYNINTFLSRVTDFSSFRDVKRLILPHKLFHNCFRPLNPAFFTTVISTSPVAEYALRSREAGRIRGCTCRLTFAYIFYMYAGGYKKVNLEPFEFDPNLQLNPVYIDVLGACEIRELTVSSDDIPLLRQLFLTREYDRSLVRRKMWPKLKTLVITGDDATHPDITREYRNSY